MRARRSFLPLALALVLAAAAVAQQASKRPLTHKDYDNWRSILNPALFRDGKRLAYAVFPQEGDGEVIVKDLVTGKEQREPAGMLPPPPDPNPDEPEEAAPRPRGVRLAFSGDGKFLVTTTFPSKADTDKAKKEKKKAEEMPKGGLVIFDLTNGTSVRVADVKSFQISEKGAPRVAYLKEGKPAADEKKPGRTEYGSELVLRDLAKGAERSFQDVLEYALSKDGQTLAFTVSSRKNDENGLYIVATEGEAAPAPALKGKGKYVKLTWDREQTRLAFLSDRDDTGARQPKSKLYTWERKTGAVAELVSNATPGFRVDFVISDRGTLAFSRDGGRILTPCGPPRPTERPAESTPVEGKVVADLWHWKDDYVQPMQKVRAARERTRTFTAVYDIARKKFVQVADPTMQTALLSDDGRFALGTDDRAYRSMVDYDGNYADQYLVDTGTGARRRILEKQRGGYGGGGGGRGAGNPWAPDGKHILYFRDKHWYTASVPAGISVNLTAEIPAKFWDDETDTPGPPPSFGTAGWTRDSKFVLLYDRNDIWQVAANGTAATNLTNGYGRKNGIQFRVTLAESEDEDDPAARGIDRDKPLLLRAEDLDTRDTGVFRTRLDSRADPQKLLMEARNFRPIAKAKEGDTVLLTASTFNEFPDLQVTDISFGKLRKVTDANPQKKELLWGTGEMIRFKSADGVALHAALFKPENFDASKKYPLMVYIYEKLSQGLHNFVDPRPGHSINAAYYVSNGYLVLMPDIVYTIGTPGQSALRCVLPAIQAVVDRGYVNEDAIGIQGHSWGGYQIAYMVTQTRRFRAAEAGAPVGNMISAYNGIRWGTGLPRQFQYEKTQSRIGGSIWQYPMRFVENSPVFMADRVETPLLILANDNDDAVPWYQGIELFLSLRRNGKEAYLFNYNGEPHGIRKRWNQKDYTARLQQFFDHFLKGAPKPEWMEKGIPYLEREERFNGHIAPRMNANERE